MSALAVSPLIGNGMVIQRGVPVPVWGEAAPGARVSVKFLGRVFRAKSGADGRWRFSLPAQPAGGPHALSVSSSGEKRLFSGIFFGDVWVCSGQSNMEMPMQRLRDDFPEEWEAPASPLIRQFKVPQEWEFSGPRQDLSGGSWTEASAATLGEFSGTAWFFAKEMAEKRGVPIGLVLAAWGGTPVEAWMSGEALAAFPEKAALCRKYADSSLCASIARQNAAAIKVWSDALAIGDRGLVEKWHKPQEALSQWGKIALPGVFSKAGLDKFYGAVWLRKQVDVGADFAARDSMLWLGTIADSDTAYVNGVEVGGTGYRYPPRKYAVPAGLLREGKNWITLRVVCSADGGGVTEGKDLRLFSGLESIDLDGTWEYRVGMRVAKPCPEMVFFQRVPMGLFNAMISPLLGLPCRGILWYQGESNEPNASEYAALFAAHIADWQAKWRAACGCDLAGDAGASGAAEAASAVGAGGAISAADASGAGKAAGAGGAASAADASGAGKAAGASGAICAADASGTGSAANATAADTASAADAGAADSDGFDRPFGIVPFIFAQLPIFGAPEDNSEASSWAALREAQCSALALPGTGMAAALELGEWNDLHPVDKQGVGRRLALAAERLLFGGKNTAPGPMLKSAELKGGRLRLAFDNCGKGLVARQEPFVTIVANGQRHRLPAEIAGADSLSVDVSSVQAPEKVLYAWANNPRDRHLFNSEGLPVIPFRAKIKA